jgi:hypothetical protein
MENEHIFDHQVEDFPFLFICDKIFIWIFIDYLPKLLKI